MMREYAAGYGGLFNGLRPTNRAPVNSDALVRSQGGFADIDGFKTLPTLGSIPDFEALGEAFPYPQLFVLRDTILVCGATRIWEYDGTSLSLMISALSEGMLWTIADFQEYILLNNGVVVVERRSTDRIYSIVNDPEIPAGYAFTNHKGQLIVAAPLAWEE